MPMCYEMLKGRMRSKVAAHSARVLGEPYNWSSQSQRIPPTDQQQMGVDVKLLITSHLPHQAQLDPDVFDALRMALVHMLPQALHRQPCWASRPAPSKLGNLIASARPPQQGCRGGLGGGQGNGWGPGEGVPVACNLTKGEGRVLRCIVMQREGVGGRAGEYRGSHSDYVV